MATHTFDLGEIVTIFNQTLGGRFIIEGTAAIVKRVNDVDEQYVVRFFVVDKQYPVRFWNTYDRSTYGRFVDPAGQDDPEAHVARLNSKAAPDAAPNPPAPAPQGDERWPSSFSK